MAFNENTRVKIPAILHLCRLGYSYVSIAKAKIDESTNIFTDIFAESILRINPELNAGDIKNIFDDLSLALDNEDLGKIFYEKITDIYEEFSEEMKVRKKKLLEEFEKLDQKLSNPKELIHFTTKLTANLAPVWDSGDYYEKQIFQNTIFPAGLGYDSKIEHYRTPIVNSVIELILGLSNDLGQQKSRTSQNIQEKSGLVPGAGVEPARFPTGV